MRLIYYTASPFRTPEILIATEPPRPLNQFVTEFAKSDYLGCDFFAKDVLGKASPEVNQMFYESARDYALNHTKFGDEGQVITSAAGQSMAADAMQALSQTNTPNAMKELAALSSPDLKKLVGAAMKGEAAHGANTGAVVDSGYRYPGDKKWQKPTQDQPCSKFKES